LQALADHGRTTDAVVTRLLGGGGGGTEYRYEVDGRSYYWNVARRDAPYAPGTVFPISYLPEDPSLSRPIAHYAPVDFERENNRLLTRGIVVGSGAFFAFAAIACHVQLRRARRGPPPRRGPTLSPATLGRLLAGLLMAVLLGVNRDEQVVQVQRALWGPTPLGLPLMWVVCVAQLVLFAPLFWLMPHLMGLVVPAQAAGGSLTKAGIVAAVLQAGPAQHRSKRIVIACSLYFLALFAAWIAYTSHRGV
jgi:hypothetical protein